MNTFAKINLYFFSEKDVDLKNNIVFGTFYDPKKKKWRKDSFPFPDVYYNRRGGELKRNKRVQNVRKTFDQLNISKINAQHFYDKWFSYVKLKQYPELKPHLPHTTLFQSKQDLKDMFKTTSRVYLKSLKQNNGVGVMSVSKTKKGYTYKYYRKTKLHKQTVKNLNRLMKVIRSFFQNKPFIVQKAIDLLTYQKRPLDLRCDVQRNGKGSLEFVAHSVRVGSKNAHITNTKSNPNIYRFEDFFKNHMGYSNEQFNQLKQRLETFLFLVYQRVEDCYGPFGEMGMGIDIGIDQQKQLWLIECNVKPGKNSMWVYDEKTINRAFYNPLSYT
ncbi:YheC/YheD family protein [Texcoconibacillus texcoconensis]|uniref:YheC/YheD family protein n=1 Tax=Texcoconibacillus texcoconensis TaxID=1095777 RepID=A0A840QM61_9BACI|nr:YheC/YheD family protein [Texcoconibacillus texcoconensis]MBB5172420.1 hypothetical protein [Texcoconibacillus texcoconensis]